MRRRFRLDWPHETGWAEIPCDCPVCRADRAVNSIAGVIVGIAIGYFGGHLFIAFLRSL